MRTTTLLLTEHLIGSLPSPAGFTEEVYRDALSPNLVLCINRFTRAFFVLVPGLESMQQAHSWGVCIGVFPQLALDDARAVARLAIPQVVSVRPRRRRRESPTIAANPSSEDFLTTREAAELTKMSVAWYERKRCYGGGPPFVKPDHTVRYVRGELLAWWARERGKTKP